MLNSLAKGTKHIYLAIGLSSVYFYPYILDQFFNNNSFMQKDEDKNIIHQGNRTLREVFL